jgi:hypothetical protein
MMMVAPAVTPAAAAPAAPQADSGFVKLASAPSGYSPTSVEPAANEPLVPVIRDGADGRGRIVKVPQSQVRR